MIVFLNDSIVIKITFIQHPSKNRSYPVWFCNLTVHFLVKHKDPQGCIFKSLLGNVYQHSKCLLRGSLNLNQVIKIKKKSAL